MKKLVNDDEWCVCVCVLARVRRNSSHKMQLSLKINQQAFKYLELIMLNERYICEIEKKNWWWCFASISVKIVVIVLLIEHGATPFLLKKKIKKNSTRWLWEYSRQAESQKRALAVCASAPANTHTRTHTELLITAILLSITNAAKVVRLIKFA